LGVIGSGFQAETQVEAVAAVRAIRLVRVWSRSADKRQQFARRLAERTEIEVQAVESARDAVSDADVVVTATNAKEPVLEAEWITAGTHINAVGSNQIGKRELPTELVYGKADLVAVDSVEQSKMESGDLMIPLKEDARLSYRAAEFADIVSRKIHGRTNDDEITVFKSNGLAVEDLAAAGYVVEKGIYS
jgi:ornithine cyclodeaminase/alanine dehydrogenase-like protein (mu-crystallin family)